MSHSYPPHTRVHLSSRRWPLRRLVTAVRRARLGHTSVTIIALVRTAGVVTTIRGRRIAVVRLLSRVVVGRASIVILRCAVLARLRLIPVPSSTIIVLRSSVSSCSLTHRPSRSAVRLEARLAATARAEAAEDYEEEDRAADDEAGHEPAYPGVPDAAGVVLAVVAVVAGSGIDVSYDALKWCKLR